MRRRARLANIAGGLCGSFTSRNNDLDGYWAIGQLCSLAAKNRRNDVSIDLLAPSMQPASPECARVLARYRRLLAKLIRLAGILPEEILVACITIDFAPPPWPRALYHKARWGEQFVVTVAIGADGRADGIVRQSGYCRPHDAASERRSIRQPDAWPGVMSEPDSSIDGAT